MSNELKLLGSAILIFSIAFGFINTAFAESTDTNAIRLAVSSIPTSLDPIKVKFVEHNLILPGLPQIL